MKTMDRLSHFGSAFVLGVGVRSTYLKLDLKFPDSFIFSVVVFVLCFTFYHIIFTLMERVCKPDN